MSGYDNSDIWPYHDGDSDELKRGKLHLIDEKSTMDYVYDLQGDTYEMVLFVVALLYFQ